MVPFNWWSYLGITGSEQRVLNKTKNASHLRFLHLAAASLFRCRRIKRRFSSSPVSALRVGCRRPLQEQFQGHNLAKKMMIFERGRKSWSDGFWTELSWNMIAGHRACQPSRWVVTLMDVHFLGKGIKCVAAKNSDNYTPGQGSSVLPERGREVVIGNSSFPNLFCSFIWSLWVQFPRPDKFFTHKLLLKRVQSQVLHWKLSYNPSFRSIRIVSHKILFSLPL